MTGDEFHARYALLEQVAGAGARSFHAVTPSGGVVMVHFLDGGLTPANLALLSAVERLEPGRRARVREVTSVDGAVAVVTELIAEFRSLPAWLEVAPAAAEPAQELAPIQPASTEPAAPPLGASAGNTGQGDFTRLFRAGDLAAAAAKPAREAAESSPAPVPGPFVDAPEPRPAPGAFTRLFRALDPNDAALGPTRGHLGGAETASPPDLRPAQPEWRAEPPRASELPTRDAASTPDGAADSVAAEPTPGGAYTRMFARMEPPEHAAPFGEHRFGGPLSSSIRADGETDGPGYLERLYAPGPEPLTADQADTTRPSAFDTAPAPPAPAAPPPPEAPAARPPSSFATALVAMAVLAVLVVAYVLVT